MFLLLFIIVFIIIVLIIIIVFIFIIYCSAIIEISGKEIEIMFLLFYTLAI